MAAAIAEATANTTANASAAKGVAGGYIFRAPIGSDEPTDIESKLDAAYKCMGFISEDGVVFTTESDSEDIVDMNGDPIDSSRTSYLETFVCTLAEVKKSVLEGLYGSANVKDANGILDVSVKGTDPEHFAYVFELVLKNGRRWRRIVHDAQVSEMGDLTVKAGELFAREATFKAFPNAEGEYYHDLFESTETSKGA